MDQSLVSEGRHTLNKHLSEFKRCINCHQTKPLHMFHLDKSRVDGHQYKCKECTAALDRARYEANPDKHRAVSNNRYWANPEESRAYLRAHRAAHPDQYRAYSQNWRRANPEKASLKGELWTKTHPFHVMASRHNRRAAKAGAEGRVTHAEIEALFLSQNGTCTYCQRTEYKLNLDHIVPLTLGGRGSIENFTFACARCNASKGQRTPEMWVNRWYLR